jgi:hypothetical protein
MNPKIKFPRITTMTLLILMLPACMYALTPLSAQSDDSSSDGGGSGDSGSASDGGSSGDGSSNDGSSSSSSASQDYQEFQSCLSGAEVEGSVSEQQIRDCFAPIYNTGTTTTGSTPSDTPSGGEGATNPSTSGANDAGGSNNDNAGSGGSSDE